MTSETVHLTDNLEYVVATKYNRTSPYTRTLVI